MFPTLCTSIISSCGPASLSAFVSGGVDLDHSSRCAVYQTGCFLIVESIQVLEDEIQGIGPTRLLTAYIFKDYSLLLIFKDFPPLFDNRSLSEVFFLCKYFHSACGFSFHSHGMVFSRAEDFCFAFSF